jgi:hypothetical protein
MDDIICPECGRPNLFKAEKCWYCQTSLQEIKKTEIVNNSAAQQEKSLDYPLHEGPVSNEEPEHNIPEWLKLVRELKEADQPPEECDPNWQQQYLFDSKKKTRKNTKTEKKKPVVKNPITPKDRKNERKNDNPLELPIVKSENEILDQEDEESSEDLPDGFTKL